MLGQIRWSERRKAELVQEMLLDLPLLTLYLPQHSSRQRQKKCLRRLKQHRVTRVLTPLDFALWPTLLQIGLRPVDTGALRCALAPRWVDTALRSKGMRPDRAVVCLRGERVSPAMERVAHALCPMVRNLVVQAGGGSALTDALRREYGMPVLPTGTKAVDLTLSFAPGPMLHGVTFSLPGRVFPADWPVLQVLCVLWESGRIKAEEIVLRM